MRTDNEGKEGGSRAAAGLWVGGGAGYADGRQVSSVFAIRIHRG